nr:xylulose kinase-1 [Tanacetum cinerariifolium]
MSLTFADTHNKVSYLNKSNVSKGFNQVIDFLNASYIKYALTINPHIYVSCIKQFWNTIVVKQTNDVTRLQALVDKKKVVIMEATIRDALCLDDAEGKVFANIRRVGKGFSGAKTPLFEGMLVAGVIEEEGDAEEHVQDVAEDAATQGADTAVIGDVVQDQSIPSPTPPTLPPQQPQDLPSTSHVQHTPPQSLSYNHNLNPKLNNKLLTSQ